MKTVIMAGGKGTRIATVNAHIPKPMIAVAGKPVLERQLDVLKRQGCTDIILVIGHFGQVIRDYFGDGSRFGVSIRYIEEAEPLGTAGALFYIKDALDDDFLLVNGDIVFDIDVPRFLRYHKQEGGAATLFTHPNDHPYDSGIIVSNKDGVVTAWLHKERMEGWYPNRVNAGIHILSPTALSALTAPEKTDLDRQVLAPLVGAGQLMAYESSEYARDMGTPDRLAQVEREIAYGLPEARNLKNKQKAVFLDRDGTLNHHIGFLTSPEQLTLIDGAAKAVRAVNSSGYLAVLVTNQPVVARGDVTLDQLDIIHNKLQTLLGKNGAYLDAVYVCPHHPDKGYDGEISALKIDCDCRKPKPGLLFAAARDYNIDLEHSIMIGDQPSDVAAGEAAGCRSILLGNGLTITQAVSDILNVTEKTVENRHNDH